MKVQISTIDEEFEKSSRVKAHVRTRKGKMERVKEHSRIGRPRVSEKRIANVKTALPFVEWSGKPTVRIHGTYGDRPQLEFTGEYKGHKIVYRTASPAGGSATLRVLHPKKGSVIGGVIPGALSKLSSAKEEIESRIETGWGLPQKGALEKWRESLKGYKYVPWKPKK